MPANEKPIGELVQQLSQQTATLVRQELRLAQLELKEKGRHAGIGGGLFGGAGLFGFLGLATLVAGIVLLVATAVADWLAAVIVALVLFAAAGAAALAGRSEFQRASPPAPEAAVETVREDIEYVKERARSA